MPVSGIIGSSGVIVGGAVFGDRLFLAREDDDIALLQETSDDILQENNDKILAEADGLILQENTDKLIVVWVEYLIQENGFYLNQETGDRIISRIGQINYVLQENGDFLQQETGYKIIETYSL